MRVDRRQRQMVIRDRLKIYNGRIVMLGDQIVDDSFETAKFQDLGSSPPAIEAARSVDALGCFDGYEVTTNDANSAYLQSFLKGPAITYVRLPRERWPKEWIGKYHDPVVEAILSHYGHPDAGGHWELHCEEQVINAGFEKIASDAWRGVFWHPKYMALLIVYVDDFKLASRKEDTKLIWKELQKRIDMGEPEPPDRFLGCYTKPFEARVCDVAEYLQNSPEWWPRGNDGQPLEFTPKDKNKEVRGFVYDMKQYFEDALNKYCEVAGIDRDQVKAALTPFLDESKEFPGYVEEPQATGSDTKPKKKKSTPSVGTCDVGGLNRGAGLVIMALMVGYAVV